MTVVGSTPSCVSEWPGAKLSLPSPSASSSSTGLGTGSRGGGSTPLSRRPPSLAIFTASYPTSPTTSLASSATTSGSSSASAAVSSFILPNAGPSLAARRQHKRAPALGGGKGFVPSLPAALDLTRVPTLEEEIARLPDLLSRLSLKRKSPPALGSMNMTLAGRKKARYLIVVDEEDEDDASPNPSPLTPHHPPTPPIHFEIHTPPVRRRHGPKKRVRFADELETHHHAK